MKSEYAAPGRTQVHRENGKTRSSKLLSLEQRENPWESKDLLDLGWSEFMKKKAEETLKSIDETKINECRKKRTLARTSSAPVNIPKQRHRHPKSDQPKKNLVRVHSTGTPALAHSEGSSRISYGRDFLLTCRQSPLSLTPPTNLPVIPGATAPFQRRVRKNLEKTDSNVSASSVTSVSSIVSAASSSAEEEAKH